MNKYRVSYYTSGGYKTSGMLKTDFTIMRNAENELCLCQKENTIGDVTDIEKLFLEQLGWHEEITIVEAHLEKK